MKGEIEAAPNTLSTHRDLRDKVIMGFAAVLAITVLVLMIRLIMATVGATPSWMLILGAIGAAIALIHNNMKRFRYSWHRASRLSEWLALERFNETYHHPDLNGVAVIIPAYNEAATLQQTLNAMRGSQLNIHSPNLLTRCHKETHNKGRSRLNIVVTGGRLYRPTRGASAHELGPSRFSSGSRIDGAFGNTLLDRRPGAAEKAIPTGADVVIHLAAATSVLGSVERPVEVYQNNVMTTAAILERCRTIHAAQFIYCSTNAVVGDVGTQTICEKTALRPLTPYGATKAAGEMLVFGYASAYGMAGTVLRLTNVYGPGMHVKDAFITRLMRAALTRTSVSIYGSGSQERGYVYVDDVVDALILALHNPWIDPLVIGSGVSISVNRLHRLVAHICGVPILAEHIQERKEEMPAVRADISGVQAMGYAPKMPLSQGLQHAWDDFQTRMPNLLARNKG